MNAELILYPDEGPPKKMPMGPIFQIGRGPVNDLVINDSRASRNHAVIRLQGDHLYYLLDLGSSNGTLLNGRRISIPSILKQGDEIQIANSRLQFVCAETGEPNSVSVPVEEMRTQVEFKSETVSILVVDIRNYTVLSEKIPAEYLSQIVGKWFQAVGLVIEQHQGSIDKFIGDAVMAVWLKAHTESDRSYAIHSIQSAIELVTLARSFHSELSSVYPDYGFQVGCGINSGRAILGNVGVDARRDITAVGDCVNVAFRLESLCKQLNHPIIISEEVKNAAGSQFTYEDLGAHKVKGKSQDLRIFTVKI